MRTALVADWLVTYGGAERVLRELCDLFPDSSLWTTVARHGHLGPLDDRKIRTSGLQRWYRLLKHHQLLLPWMSGAVEQLDMRGVDVVISSSHAVAKGIIPESGTLHVCYCHTPMRYAWEMEEKYFDDFRIPHIIRPLLRKQLRSLRRWDLTSAQRVDVFIANSRTTQERIERIYGRDSVVIPPPVDDRFFETPLTEQRATHFLAVGRLVPYKRFDLLIETANALRLPLLIVGTGQDEARLRRMAGPTVTFLGYVPDDRLPSLYTAADAFLFPQEEDAGITLLQAQACGTPVIAYRAGGAVDIVEENRTGIFFDAQNPDSLGNALSRFRQHAWDRASIRKSAEKYRRAIFQEAIRRTIGEAWNTFRKQRATMMP